jgi:hypothetical protein
VADAARVADHAPLGALLAFPSGVRLPPHLLRYAKSIDLPLAISRAASLDGLATQTTGEVLVVCLQFRHGHAGGDARADVLNKVRGLNPELVVLSELDADGGGDGTAAGVFMARLEMLWRFLESTAATFRGRDGMSAGSWRPRRARRW